VTSPEGRAPLPPDALVALVQRANAGDRAALRRLIEEVLSPVVQARVARVLLRRSAGRWDARQAMKDLAQQVFVHVFETRALARWDPARGSLQSFVGLIAENFVRSILRSRVQSPFTLVPTDDEKLELHLPGGDGHEEVVITRDALRQLDEAFDDAELDEFYLFFIDERSIEDVCALTGKSRDAVYKQRQRLRDKARQILGATMSNARAPRSKPEAEEP
jgi:DNA-directed RNA polymerase specialized sigma24 family protein